MTRFTLRSLILVVTCVAAAPIVGTGEAPALKSGLDTALFDKAVRPQDDLFRHVNGGWLAKTEIPPDRPLYGSFVLLAEKAENDLHALIEELGGDKNKRPGSLAQQVGDFYASYLNESRINALGAAPLKAHLASIDALTNAGDFAELTGRLSVIGLPGPAGGFINADAGDPDKVVLYLVQGGTGLPDRDYYLADDARSQDIRTKYQAYLEKVFTLAGRPRAAEDAGKVLDLEIALAKIQWSRVESRDAVKTYNKFQMSSLNDKMPGFDWARWAKAQGLDKAGDVIIQQPSFFTGFAAMVPTTPLDTWKAWLTAQVITMNAAYLSQPFIDAAFEMFARTLAGQQQLRPRWKRGVQLVNGSMGEALGQLYVKKHYPEQAKARMDAMIANLLEAYKQSITSLEWMTPETRQQALEKLSKFSPKVGYPKNWRDYGALTVSADDLVGNVERSRKLDHEHEVQKLGRPVDREEWLMTPQTVNAYYNPVKNEIVFPASILQPPFFNVEADDAVNYGGIGAVIGHEIGHGFDDQGRRYDGTGKLHDWWKPADEAEFQKRAKVLVEQFSAYSPFPGANVNGQLTLGENIGDLGGLAIAYKAWQISLKGKPSPVIDGLTGDQRFFMGWAQVWRLKARDEYLRNQLKADTHSPAEYRANGPLGNIPEFYAAFDVKPGDKLYIAPEKRVKIW